MTVACSYLPPGWSDDRERCAREVLGQLTALLTEPSVPDEITETVGAMLYRFFA